MKLYLIVAKGKHKGMAIEIKIDLFLIGSDRMCQLRSKLPGIVPQHCAILTREDRKVFVRDLASGNTELNGDLLPPGEEWPLHAGDRLEVGPLEFLIQFNEKQLSQRDAEEWALRSLDAEDSKRERSDDEEVELGEPHARGATDASSAADAILGKLQALKGVVKGRLRISPLDDITVAAFNDVYLVDQAEISLIKKELLNNLTRRGLRVLLDFKNVQRMSSSAADMIREVALKMRAQENSVALCRLRPDLMPILEAMGILDKIRYFPDKKAAQAARW